MSAVPKRTVANALECDARIVVVSDPHEQVACVLVDDKFETLQHLSGVLDRFELKVEKTTWVDEGQKVYLKPGQTVAVG